MHKKIKCTSEFLHQVLKSFLPAIKSINFCEMLPSTLCKSEFLGGGNGILNSAMEFPLTLSDPNERAPYTFKYLNYMADRHMHYGHVVPNVNLFVVGKDKIMERLMQNRLNPTMVG